LATRSMQFISPPRTPLCFYRTFRLCGKAIATAGRIRLKRYVKTCENLRELSGIFLAARNIRSGAFVYTSAAEYGLFRPDIEKPRGGSRGVVTRSLSGR
jgi:hypothetical protein